MASKWSNIWSDAGLTRGQKEVLVKQAAYTAPSPAKKKAAKNPAQQPANVKKAQPKFDGARVSGQDMRKAA